MLVDYSVYSAAASTRAACSKADDDVVALSDPFDRIDVWDVAIRVDDTRRQHAYYEDAVSEAL